MLIIPLNLDSVLLFLHSSKLAYYRRTPVIGKVFEVNEDGFIICYWRDFAIKNGHPTRFPHVDGIRKAGYG